MRIKVGQIWKSNMPNFYIFITQLYGDIVTVIAFNSEESRQTWYPEQFFLLTGAHLVDET